MSRYPICLSLFGSTTELVEQIFTSPGADLFEIRLDLSPEIRLDQVRLATTRPLLFTAHSRPDLLGSALPFADFYDVEQKYLPDVRCIVSIHAPQGDPRKIWLDLPKNHLAKIVLDTEDYASIAQVLELDCAHHPRAIGFAMGEIGAFSRILSVFRGAPWIFAALPGRLTGPGQFTLDELLHLYRLPRFSVEPSMFGIVGYPVSHSKSPEFHNRRFEQHSLPWIYLPFPCKDLRSLFYHAPQFGVRGFSITHPYKEEIFSFLQHQSPEVNELRSCNTVCFRDGEWYGHNTDIEGVRELLRKHQVSLSGKRAVILGAGGAARAIATVIRPYVSELSILNRTPEKAKGFALPSERSGGLEAFGKFPYDVLFQATSSGLNEGQCPVDPALVLPGTTVIEANYHPAETLLLKVARENGCKTINGEYWFEAQAEAQFRWWLDMLGK